MTTIKFKEMQSSNRTTGDKYTQTSDAFVYAVELWIILISF